MIWVAPLLAVIALIAVFSYSQHETRYRNALAAPRRPAPEAQELYLKGEYRWTKRTPEDPEEAYPRALAAARKAVELDDTSAGSHNSLASDTFNRKWDSAIAEREFKPALALDPNFVQGHHWYATFLLTSGRRLHEALDRIELARKLDPSSTTIQADKAWILFYAGRKSEAFSLLKQLESTDPALAATHDYLATIYFDRKDYDNFFAESK